MKVAAIGATGRTGQAMLAELLERGHDVTALVRDPAKLGGIADRVKVVQGSSTDRAAMSELVAGTDAVLSALGPTSKEPDLHTKTATLLVELLPVHGRFIGVSGAGIDVPGDQKGPRDKVISFMIQKLGGAVVKDKPAEYEVFAASELDWTLVRPPRLVDGEATGKIVHDAHKPGRSSSIRRADLGRFLVTVLDEGLYVRQAPFVSGG
jgi:putative NADH-flavin reductase